MAWPEERTNVGERFPEAWYGEGLLRTKSQGPYRANMGSRTVSFDRQSLWNGTMVLSWTVLATITYCGQHLPLSHLSCDVNINTPLGVLNSEMIKTYVAIDPRVRPFAMIIKHWARKRVLNDAGKDPTLPCYFELFHGCRNEDG